jgi:hypothetical protein
MFSSSSGAITLTSPDTLSMNTKEEEQHAHLLVLDERVRPVTSTSPLSDEAEPAQHAPAAARPPQRRESAPGLQQRGSGPVRLRQTPHPSRTSARGAEQVMRGGMDLLRHSETGR